MQIVPEESVMTGDGSFDDDCFGTHDVFGSSIDEVDVWKPQDSFRDSFVVKDDVWTGFYSDSDSDEDEDTEEFSVTTSNQGAKMTSDKVALVTSNMTQAERKSKTQALLTTKLASTEKKKSKKKSKRSSENGSRRDKKSSSTKSRRKSKSKDSSSSTTKRVDNAPKGGEDGGNGGVEKPVSFLTKYLNHGGTDPFRGSGTTTDQPSIAASEPPVSKISPNISHKKFDSSTNHRPDDRSIAMSAAQAVSSSKKTKNKSDSSIADPLLKGFVEKLSVSTGDLKTTSMHQPRPRPLRSSSARSSSDSVAQSEHMRPRTSRHDSFPRMKKASKRSSLPDRPPSKQQDSTAKGGASLAGFLNMNSMSSSNSDLCNRSVGARSAMSAPTPANIRGKSRRWAQKMAAVHKEFSDKQSKEIQSNLQIDKEGYFEVQNGKMRLVFDVDT